MQRYPPSRHQMYNRYLTWSGAAVVVGLSIIFILIGRAFHDRQPAVMAAKEEKVRAELEQEFKAIIPLSTNAPIYYLSCSANGNNGCNRSYRSPLTYVDVKASYLAGNYMPTVVFDHYDKQLREHGWTFIGNSSDHTWDTTGKSSLWGNDFPKIIEIGAEWGKDKYCAGLTYHNYPSMTGPWEYSLQMTWDGTNCSD